MSCTSNHVLIDLVYTVHVVSFVEIAAFSSLRFDITKFVWTFDFGSLYFPFNVLSQVAVFDCITYWVFSF